MSKMGEYLYQQVELVEGEFKGLKYERLQDLVCEQLSKISMSEYKKMEEKEKVSFIVKGVRHRLNVLRGFVNE